MLNDEDLEFIRPRMSIEYRDEKGFLSGGTFENVPVGAFGARVATSFPIVAANGEFMLSGDVYNLFVGEAYDVEGLAENVHTIMETSESMAAKIQKYEASGVKQAVLTEAGLFPLVDGDATFKTRDDMVQAIEKINSTFKSVSFSMQNVEAQNSEVHTAHR